VRTDLAFSATENFFRNDRKISTVHHLKSLEYLSNTNLPRFCITVSHSPATQIQIEKEIIESKMRLTMTFDWAARAGGETVSGNRRIFSVKRFLGLVIGVFFLIGFASLTEAITIDVAEVQNGAAYVQGGKAAANAKITWEGANVATANKNGGFKFSGAVPSDCVGTLSDGVSSIQVLVLACTSVSAGTAPVPRTGQTTSYTARDDGALQKGVTWQTPRFTDNSNGTITDNLTGLIWLKNANCPNTNRNWPTALNDVASLNSTGTMNGNDCGDTSNGGTHQTDWRLPNVRELSSLLDYAFFCSLCPSGGNNPAIPNTAGTGQGSDNDPFLNFVANDYSSSTTAAGDSGIIWVVDFGVGFGGGGIYYAPKTQPFFVIAVRGGS